MPPSPNLPLISYEPNRVPITRRPSTASAMACVGVQTIHATSKRGRSVPQLRSLSYHRRTIRSRSCMSIRIPVAAAVAVTFALAAAAHGRQDPEAQAPRPRVVVGRSKVATKYGIVAASQPLAARAGVQILERGGNAVDAAIATNAVMGL